MRQRVIMAGHHPHPPYDAMSTETASTVRHFVTYSGVSLPLNLTSPLEEADLRNRITFYRAYYDAADRMTTCEKVVYGEIESAHHYSYYPSGALQQAKVVQVIDEETTLMDYAEDGTLLASTTLDD